MGVALLLPEAAVIAATIGSTAIALAAAYVIQGAVSGFAAGVVESVMYDVLEGKKPCISCALKAGLTGAAIGASLGPLGMMGPVVKRAFGAIVPKILPKVTKLINNTTKTVKSVVNQIENGIFSTSISSLFKGGRVARASELIKYAEQQGWKKLNNQSGPIKYADKKGIIRMTIKKGSSRSPGSELSHVELRNSSGKRIDIFGKQVPRKSQGNHTKIDYDIN